MATIHRDQGATMGVSGLPVEIMHNILRWLEPHELARTKRVNRMFHDCITGNSVLFRNVYLQWLDTPPNLDVVNWETELFDFARLYRLFDEDSDPDKEADKLGFVLNTVTHLLERAVISKPDGPDEEPFSLNIQHLAHLFRNEDMANTFMQQSSLFERMRGTAFSSPRQQPPHNEDHQRSAKLHCLYGQPALRAGRTRSSRTYPYACSKVYDLRQYTENTKWGPFRDDETGRVDWEKVEAICVVLYNNTSSMWPLSGLFNDVWESPFQGSFPNSYVPTKKGKVSGLDAQDPYGITGAYYRIVCFLDYNDFFHYNFTTSEELLPSHAPRPPLNVGGATRLIIMKLHVTKIEAPGPDDGQELPVVHFEGESSAVDDSLDDNANSGITGTVRLTKEGEVRWTSISVYLGQERWRSEGIQIGGARSGRGVVGNWFDRDYDPHGPAGPTAFWKAPDSEDPEAALHHSTHGVGAGIGGLPHGLAALLQNGVLDDGMDFTVDSDEDMDDDWDVDLGPVDDELPGLLQDAGMELVALTNYAGSEHSEHHEHQDDTDNLDTDYHDTDQHADTDGHDDTDDHNDTDGHIDTDHDDDIDHYVDAFEHADTDGHGTDHDDDTE